MNIDLEQKSVKCLCSVPIDLWLFWYENIVIHQTFEYQNQVNILILSLSSGMFYLRTLRATTLKFRNLYALLITSVPLCSTIRQGSSPIVEYTEVGLLLSSPLLSSSLLFSSRLVSPSLMALPAAILAPVCVVLLLLLLFVLSLSCLVGCICVPQ